MYYVVHEVRPQQTPGYAYYTTYSFEALESDVRKLLVSTLAAGATLTIVGKQENQDYVMTITLRGD